MLFNIGPTGRTVYLSIDEVLSLSDEDYNLMIAYSVGDEIAHPLFGSCLGELSSDNPDPEEIEDPEEEHEELLFDDTEIIELMENDSIQGD
tara:strand:- start:565 stop:837 length:273 start_codon:yes stop_codon:yes gene_type:complete